MPDEIGTTVSTLLELAEELLARLEGDRTAEAVQMAEEAAAFASMFRGWLRQVPIDDDSVAATRRFFVLQRRAAEYLSQSATHTAPEEDPKLSEPPHSMAAQEQVAREAIEQLEKDPSLRGSLTEVAYAPLVEWASDRALAVVVNLGIDIDGWDGVMRVASLLSRIIRAAVIAAEVGDAAALIAALDECPRPILDRDLATMALSRLPLDDDVDRNALAIAAALRAVTPLDSAGAPMMHATSAARSSPGTQSDVQKLCPICGVRYPAEFRVCPRDAAELTEAAALQDRDEIVGTTLCNTYTIVRVIGEGGMGRVYEAHHTRIGGKRFAIKMLHPGMARQPDILTRFQREAEAAASIMSPYVAEVYDVDRTSDSRPFLVAEYLEGKELADYLTEVGRMPVGPAVRIVRQICKALAAAHANGIVHRDMKPENVFLTGARASPTAKVIDFGISRIADTPGTALTQTGMIMGTPSYMAPEQARGQRVDHRADIYAVGTILYRALTGRRPFDRGEPTATLAALLTEDPEAPRSIEPSIPPALEMVIQRAMAKSQAQRQQTMEELDLDLAPYDAGEQELLVPLSEEASDAGMSATSMLGRRTGGATLSRHAREVSMARPLIVFMSALGLFWLVGGLVTAIAASVRVLRDSPASANLTGAEAVLLLLGISAAFLTPAVIAYRHMRRTVWSNSARSIELADRLRRPVAVGLGAYGFGSLLVRIIEAVVLRRAAGLAWPVWDILMFAIGLTAGVSAHYVGQTERKRA